MKLSEHQILFTHHVGQLIMFAYSQGMALTFGDAYRSPEEQYRLFKNGKSKISTEGNHGKRLAVDFNLFMKVGGEWKITWEWKHYKVLGDYWMALSSKNRWGGDWNKNGKKDGFIDSPHFERNI